MRTMNKKGESSVSEFWTYFPRMILMIVAIVVIVVMVNNYIRSDMELQKVESEIIFNKLFYTMDGIAYVDETGTNHPHIIDLDRFNNPTLDGVLAYGSEKYAAVMLTLTQNGDIVRKAYYNQEWYNRWKPMVNAFIVGPGSATELNKKVPVLYKEGDEIETGMLEVSIIVPNSR